jgi:HD-GYP domain-containing protein (c-di-GMP phosphodiesterase class II)
MLAGGVWFLSLFLLNALHISVFLGTPEAWLTKAVTTVRENMATAALFLPIGLLMSVFLPTKPWLIPLLFVPVILIHSVMEASDKLEVETEQTILALSAYLEERDDYTSGHSHRVAGYAAAIARELGLTAGEIETTHRAGLIHDLGKIDVPDAILRKPGFLTEDERAVMRTHTDRAVELGERLVALKKGLPFHLAAYHHENFDGSGYYQMAGSSIPLVSRMLAVADTFDAMTSDRPYRKGMDDSEAILRLKKAAGTQLDPGLVSAFLKAYDKGQVEVVRSQCPATVPCLAV